MKIAMGLSPSSVASAIEQIGRYKSDFEKKRVEFCRRIAEEGSAVAAAYYGSSVKVTTEETETGYAILASGKAVCFLEFGAGYGADAAHPLAANVTAFRVYPGSYSVQNAGQFYTTDRMNPGHGFWLFGGRKYDSVQPRYAMWRARQHITREVERIAREVFK